MTTKNGNIGFKTTRSSMTTRNGNSGNVTTNPNVGIGTNNNMTTDANGGVGNNNNATTDANGGGTEEPTRQEIINRFCEYRDPGSFAFPPNCQAYVDCDDFGRATFRACANGQHFHQETRTCVNARLFTCFIELPTDDEGESIGGTYVLIVVVYLIECIILILLIRHSINPLVYH